LGDVGVGVRIATHHARSRCTHLALGLRSIARSCRRKEGGIWVTRLDGDGPSRVDSCGRRESRSHSLDH
jgi:hypothetical protein